MFRTLLLAASAAMLFANHAFAGGLLDNVQIVDTKPVDPVVTSTLRVDEITRHYAEQAARAELRYEENFIRRDGQSIEDVRAEAMACTGMDEIIADAFPFILGTSEPSWSQLDIHNASWNEAGLSSTQKLDLLTALLKRVAPQVPDCFFFIHRIETEQDDSIELVIRTGNADRILTEKVGHRSVLSWHTLRMQNKAYAYQLIGTAPNQMQWGVANSEPLS